MATVIDAVTGEEVEVVQVQAVAAVASVNSIASEFPPEAGKAIEQAMVWAVQQCSEQGITDPDQVRELMLKARADMKTHLRIQMNDLRSQQG
jgi:hypothetical protein